jgi:radical SAM superfamily enzyme YgiQ (UPF0313 family)
MKIHLAILPHFQNKSFLVPHLGMACIKAYVSKYSTDTTIKVSDFRTYEESKYIWSSDDLPQLTSRYTFVSDIYELPIIASLINKYLKYKSLKSILDVSKEEVYQWSMDRSLFYENVLEKLNKTNLFALKQLPKFGGYDLVGFSTYTSNLYLSVLMAILIKLNYPNTKIFFGGPQITQGDTTRELLLRSGIADYLILGEGEQPVLDLVNALKNNEDTSKIIGLKSFDNLEQVDTFSQSMNLEELPVPDYDGTNFYSFKPSLIPIYSNRGCPFRCHFCSEHSLFGKTFKRRSPEKVIIDMQILSKRYGLRDFSLSDSLINSSDEWLVEFTERLEKIDENFIWGGYFRAETDESLIRKMKKVGLYSAILGVESFSQQTLDKMNKKKVKQETLDTINALVDNEIYAFVNLFVGYPGEKEEDFLTTLEVSNQFYKDFRDKNKLEYFRITARNFQLRPFSNVYKAYEKFGLEAKTWSDYFDENMHPQELKNVFDKTLCSFNVKGISISETMHRLYLMQQIRKKTI